jgi:hypothetical protein
MIPNDVQRQQSVIVKLEEEKTVPWMLRLLKTTPRLSAYFFEPPMSQNSM